VPYDNKVFGGKIVETDVFLFLRFVIPHGVSECPSTKAWLNGLVPWQTIALEMANLGAESWGWD